MERKTIEKDEQFLRLVSEEVDLQKDNYLDWIKIIREYCSNNSCYALAPIQIGIPKRLIYLKNTKPDMKNNEDSTYDEELILINPVVLSQKGHTRFFRKLRKLFRFCWDS